jgi:hypothetical protein
MTQPIRAMVDRTSYTLLKRVNNLAYSDPGRSPILYFIQKGQLFILFYASRLYPLILYSGRSMTQFIRALIKANGPIDSPPRNYGP